MQLNKPATAPEFDKMARKMEPGLEPLTIKAGLVMSLSSITGGRASSARGSDKTDKIALVSCMLGSMKHLKNLDKPIVSGNIAEPHISHLIKVATEVLPKEAEFAAQRSMISHLKEEHQKVLAS